MEQTKVKKSFQVPHILLIILGLILFACFLTYFAPAGTYQVDEDGRVIAGTFEYIANTPVSPFSALLMIQKGIINAGSVIAMMLVAGGAIATVISTGAFEEILNFGVYKLEDKSVKVLVPAIVVMMSLLGAFAGGDSMIAFVTVGIVICKRLRLDRITAMGMFYLGYLIGQGASFTSNMVMNFQSTAGVAPLSGMGVRIIIWMLFTLANAIYCTRYALRISRDPSKSIVGEILEPDGDMSTEITISRFPLRATVVALVMILAYVLYAVGNQTYGWGQEYLLVIMVLNAIFSAAVYRIPANKASKTFMSGAQSMGGICLVMGMARVIGFVLTDGNVMHTIAYGASNVIGNFGLAAAGVGIFVFTLLINFAIPSGLSKAAIVIPILAPIGDVCGLTRQVVAFAYQMGDSLTNTLTPVSGPLTGALGLANVDYIKWVRYSAPLMGILAVIAGAFIAVLSAMAWVG